MYLQTDLTASSQNNRVVARHMEKKNICQAILERFACNGSCQSSSQKLMNDILRELPNYIALGEIFTNVILCELKKSV